MILQLVEAIRRSLEKGYESPEDEISKLESAIGDAMELEPELALNLEPQSLVSILDLGSFDENLGGYVVRALYYEATLLEEQGKAAVADLRKSQAAAIANKYHIEDLSDCLSAEELEAFFLEQENTAPNPESDDIGVL
jgi:hypothetical protein